MLIINNLPTSGVEMKYARYNSPNGKVVTVEEFIEKAGTNYKDKKIFPYCSFCLEIVYPKGANSIYTRSYYAHYRNENSIEHCVETLKGKRNIQQKLTKQSPKKHNMLNLITRFVRGVLLTTSK